MKVTHKATITLSYKDDCTQYHFEVDGFTWYLQDYEGELTLLDEEMKEVVLCNSYIPIFELLCQWRDSILIANDCSFSSIDDLEQYSNLYISLMKPDLDKGADFDEAYTAILAEKPYALPVLEVLQECYDRLC